MCTHSVKIRGNKACHKSSQTCHVPKQYYKSWCSNVQCWFCLCLLEHCRYLFCDILSEFNWSCVLRGKISVFRALMLNFIFVGSLVDCVSCACWLQSRVQCLAEQDLTFTNVGREFPQSITCGRSQPLHQKHHGRCLSCLKPQKTWYKWSAEVLVKDNFWLNIFVMIPM